MNKAVRALFVVALCISTAVLTSPQPARADDPGWYERYLLSVACTRQHCSKNPATELPPGLVEFVDSIWIPILRSSSIPPDEKISVNFPLRGGVNAWALKHFWGISLGLLSIGMPREEVAFVAAHELAHIELKHYEKKLGQVATIYVAAFIAILISGGNYNPLNDPYFNVAASLALAAYDREKETEADLRAIRLMAQAGFDPRASTGALLRIAPFGEAGTGDLFDTHPSIEQRVARLQRELLTVNVSVPEATPGEQALGTAPTLSPTPLSAAPLASPTAAAFPPPASPPAVAPSIRPSPSPKPVASPTPQTRAIVPEPQVIVVREVSNNTGWAAIVKVGGIEVFRIRTSYGGLDLFQRADAAAAVLNRLIGQGLKPSEVRALSSAGQSAILARKAVVMIIDPELARLNRTAAANLAARWAVNLQAALKQLK